MTNKPRNPVALLMFRLFFLQTTTLLEGLKIPLHRNHNQAVSFVGSSSGTLLPVYRSTRLTKIRTGIFFSSSSTSHNNGDPRVRLEDHQTLTEEQLVEEPMANLYREWTLDQDRTLWDNRQLSIVELASLLGRGLRGVEARLVKLKNVQGSAYQRLFGSSHQGRRRRLTIVENDEQKPENDKKKLMPVSEVLRRIRYDSSLPSHDFSVLHYDRVEDTIIESPLETPNTSIKGPKELLVDALPEHRIVGVKYRERVIWDRKQRIDLVFSDPGIARVMEHYEEWKRDHDAAVEWNRQRHRQVALEVEQILGLDSFQTFQHLALMLQAVSQDPTISTKLEVEKFVQSALDLFREVQERNPHLLTSPATTTMLIPPPRNDYESLDRISDFVSLLPVDSLRQVILSELSLRMAACSSSSSSASSASATSISIRRDQLPPLCEEDLTETFVRGSGPGGQKINKTSNRVVLVHEPTQLRVECQDTRSLQQNRKLARKRLQAKLDEHYRGSQSRGRVLAQMASVKKSKAKARSRTRQRRKQQKNTEQQAAVGGDEEGGEHPW